MGQICTHPSLPACKANTLWRDRDAGREKKGGEGREGWTEVENEQQRKERRRKRDRDKQMSARSHQLGAGILKQNV